MKKIVLLLFFVLISIMGLAQSFTDIVILPNAQNRTDFFCPNEDITIKYTGTGISGNVNFKLYRKGSYSANCFGNPVAGPFSVLIASGTSTTDTKTLLSPDDYDFAETYTEPDGSGCFNKVLRVTGFSVEVSLVSNSGIRRSEEIHLYSTEHCRGTEIQASKTNVSPGETITLTASKCLGTVKWNDGVTGAPRAVVVNQNTTYSAQCTYGNLIFDVSNSIPINVCDPAVLVINNPAVVEPPNTVDITASTITAGSTLPMGTVLSYHTDAQGNVTLPNPGTLTQSGTYYIKATTTSGCIDIKPVIVTINSCSNEILLVSPANDYNAVVITKESSLTITASNKITGASNVTYRSNKSITLLPDTNGFTVENGAVFKAEIGGCQ
jgi:hypothetical protein